MKPSTRLTNLARLACAALALAALCPAARAQRAPQDNWTYYGTSFSSPTPTNQLTSIAIGSGGVYVGERIPGNPPTKVIQFTEAGTFVSRFSATFGYVIGLACDSAGNVYVLDRGDSRVKVYDQSGTFIRQWGGAGTGNGQFTFTSQTGPTMIAVDRNDQVYVADPGNTRVQVFDTNGTFLRKWGQLGALPGQFTAGSPSRIVAASDGLVYAEAKVFDSNGTYIQTYGSVQSPVGVYGASYDGLVLRGDSAAFGVSDVSQFFNVPGRLDPALSSQFNGIPPGSSDAAFSKSGDVFCAYGTKITVFKREFQSSIKFLSPTPVPQPVVLSMNQRAGTSLLDIDYKVTDADNATVTTGLLAFKAGNSGTTPGSTLADAVVMSTFVEGTSGNVGVNQPAGTTRHVTWNMPADWAVDYANIQVEALAKDTRNLLGIHWITVPASGGDPAVQVSSTPVTDSNLLDLWFWFLATHDGCSLTRGTVTVSGNVYDTGTVMGTGGIYTGQMLAAHAPDSGSSFPQYSITPAGRLFAYEKMGVRAIYGKELARAQAGNFGFASLDAKTTVVKEAVTATSYIKGWGTNNYGQTNWLSFAGANPIKIATGGSHNLILRADGSLWAVGFNSSGQLGDGTTTARTGPVFVAAGVAQIAAGGNWSFFVKTDGTLWAMGYNGQGQLGDGTTTSRSTPVQIAASVSQVAAGGSHSVFIKTDGTLWAMGYNGQGQLGDGSTTNRSAPVQIATAVGQVAAGGSYTLFVKPGGSPSGTLWATGDNSSGQFGDGTTNNRNIPVQVATGVAFVSAGSSHSLMIKTNGSLWAMGSNGQGQLGDGTTVNRTVPVQIATGVATAAAGGSHSLFLKSDATLWAMGSNYVGQLGDGTTIQRNSPVQTDAGVTAIAAGSTTSLDIVVVAP